MKAQSREYRWYWVYGVCSQFQFLLWSFNLSLEGHCRWDWLRRVWGYMCSKKNSKHNRWRKHICWQKYSIGKWANSCIELCHTNSNQGSKELNHNFSHICYKFSSKRTPKHKDSHRCHLSFAQWQKELRNNWLRIVCISNPNKTHFGSCIALCRRDWLS